MNLYILLYLRAEVDTDQLYIVAADSAAETLRLIPEGTPASDYEVKLIGTAAPGIERGVVDGA